MVINHIRSPTSVNTVDLLESRVVPGLLLGVNMMHTLAIRQWVKVVLYSGSNNIKLLLLTGCHP